MRGSVPARGPWQHFDLAVADSVATLTLRRPERLNALTFEVYADLRDFFRDLPQRDDIAAVVLTGSGRGFCSGGDVDAIIGRLLEFDTAHLLAFTRLTGAVVQHMRDCPQVIVAAVNGDAAGAGAVLALASDFRVMSRAARFRFLFTRVGLSGGDMGAGYLLPRMVGLGRATEMLMFGEPVEAEEAVRIGLAHRAVEAEALLDTAGALARRIVEGPRAAYGATKVLLTREQDMDLSGAIEHEAQVQALLMHGDDFREFHAAFTQRRPPRWGGR